MLLIPPRNIRLPHTVRRASITMISSLLLMAPAVVAQTVTNNINIIIPQVHPWAMPMANHRPNHVSPIMVRPNLQPMVLIESVDVDVDIKGQVATTRLGLNLVNQSSQDQESQLLLPVPDGAVVTEFALEGTALSAKADLLPSHEARRIYDEIVSNLRDPALLEFAGYNLVRSSVFPVPAQGKQTIILTYEQILGGDGNRIDYAIPRSESLRQHAPWNIRFQISDETPVSMVYSPSHDLITKRKSGSSFHGEISEKARTEPGSFRLSYLRDRDAMNASVIAYPDTTSGQGGHFLFMLGMPTTDAADNGTLQREVTIVLDRSGSMAGVKLQQACLAALQVISALEDGEAFNIIDYSTGVDQFAAQPVIKTDETVRQAEAYLSSIRSIGGTNINSALRAALKQPPMEGYLSMVLFLTDGLPTVGETSEVAIRESVEEHNNHNRRIFTFGVGNDVNAPLLDHIADSSRATSTFVLPHEDVELKVARTFRQLSGPVFADTTLVTRDSAGNQSTRLVREMTPQQIPDVFDGDYLILLGRYIDNQPITFEISGKTALGPKNHVFTFDPSDASVDNSYVARLWASRQIAYLIDQIRQAGAAEAANPLNAATTMTEPKIVELVEEIMRLSTTYGILTEYTSFLATDGTHLPNTAARWGAAVGGCMTELEDRAISNRSGAGAVTQSLNLYASKNVEQLGYRNGFFDAEQNEVSFETVQQICDHTFFYRGGTWFDAQLINEQVESDPDVVIDFGTPEHMNLVRELVKERRQGVLSLDGPIVLRRNGLTYLIKAADDC